MTGPGIARRGIARADRAANAGAGRTRPGAGAPGPAPGGRRDTLAGARGRRWGRAAMRGPMTVRVCVGRRAAGPERGKGSA